MMNNNNNNSTGANQSSPLRHRHQQLHTEIKDSSSNVHESMDSSKNNGMKNVDSMVSLLDNSDVTISSSRLNDVSKGLLVKDRRDSLTLDMPDVPGSTTEVYPVKSTKAIDDDIDKEQIEKDKQRELRKLEKKKKIEEMLAKEKYDKRVNFVKRAFILGFLGAGLGLFFAFVYPGIMPVGNDSKYYKTECVVGTADIQYGSVCTTSGTTQTCKVGSRVSITMQYTPEKKYIQSYTTAFIPSDGSYTLDKKTDIVKQFKAEDILNCWIDNSNGYSAIIETAQYYSWFWMYLGISIMFFVLALIMILEGLGVFSFKSIAFRIYTLLAKLHIIQDPKHKTLDTFKCSMKRPSIISIIFSIGALIGFVYILVVKLLQPMELYDTLGYLNMPATIQRKELQNGQKCTDPNDPMTCVEGQRWFFYLSFKGPQNSQRFTNAYYPLDGSYVKSSLIPDYVSNFAVGEVLEYTYIGGQNLDLVVIQYYQYDSQRTTWIIVTCVLAYLFISFTLDILGLCGCLRALGHCGCTSCLPSANHGSHPSAWKNRYKDDSSDIEQEIVSTKARIGGAGAEKTISTMQLSARHQKKLADLEADSRSPIRAAGGQSLGPSPVNLKPRSARKSVQD